MTTIAELVHDELAVKLATIKATAGYNTTVTTVEQKTRLPEQVGTGELPYIGIAKGDDSYQYISGEEHTVATFELVCILAATTHAAAVQALDDLREDLRSLFLSEEPTLGVSGVVWVKPARRRSIPHDEVLIKAGWAVMAIDVEIKWIESW